VVNWADCFVVPPRNDNFFSMTNVEKITPLIITYNEAPNIARTLDALKWAKRIVVVDSFSTDETLAILQQYPQVALYQRPFKSFADQCNFGIEQVQSEWVLSLDADYVLDNTLIAYIQSIDLQQDIAAAYNVRFKYAIFGKPLRGTLYPPRKVLYAKEKAHYENDGHGHRVVIDGTIGQLEGYIHHDDRKPFTHWLASQDKYMKQEIAKLNNTPLSNLGFNDRIRRLIVPAPFLVVFYCLILKGGILDGWRGWYYAFQRMIAEMIFSVRLIEAKVAD
jgi:glycosyltransferase involved in cell wall biosynthesis